MSQRVSGGNPIFDSLRCSLQRNSSLQRQRDDSGGSDAHFYVAVPSDVGEESEHGEPLSELEFEDCVIPEDEKSSSPFYFVEAGWFQFVVAAVIFSNVVMIIIEAQYPATEDLLYFPEFATLCFYIFELVCRIRHFRYHFFGGPWRFVVWSILDVIVVSAGVLEFALPAVPSKDIQKAFEGPLQVLLLLRMLRVFKIVRIFLESDLSWAESATFQSFIGGVIAFNALLMGFETDFDWEGWFFIEQVLLVIYAFELMVRLKRKGLKFFSCYNPDANWNWLDTAIVGSSAADSWGVPLLQLLMEKFHLSKEAEHPQHQQAKGGGMNLSQLMMLMRMLRLMRILRLVKLVKTVEPLYILVTGVAAAVQGVTWVLILTIVILYAISILSTRLIGHGMVFPDQDHLPEGVVVFRTVPDSMFTLFRVMSGAQSDEEAAMIDTLMMAMPTIKFAFVFFMVTSSWTLLSILTAVVSENMIKTCGEQTEELNMISHEEDRQRHRADLETLFESMDYNKNDELEFQELDEVLNSKEMAAQVAKLVRVPVRNVREVFKTLSRNGKQVEKDVFVECMLEVAKPVTEQSVMKIQAQILDTGKLHSDTMASLDRKVVQGLERCSTILDKIDKSWADKEDVRGCLAELSKKQESSIACSIKLIERLGKLEAGIESLRHQLLSAGHNTMPNAAQWCSNSSFINGSAKPEDACRSIPFSSSDPELDSMVQRLREQIERRSSEAVESVCKVRPFGASTAGPTNREDVLHLLSRCAEKETQTDLLLRNGQSQIAELLKHEETQSDNPLRNGQTRVADCLKAEDLLAKEQALHIGANVDRVCSVVDALTQCYKQELHRNGSTAKVDARDADRFSSAFDALSQKAGPPSSNLASDVIASSTSRGEG